MTDSSFPRKREPVGYFFSSFFGSVPGAAVEPEEGALPEGCAPEVDEDELPPAGGVLAEPEGALDDDELEEGELELAGGVVALEELEDGALVLGGVPLAAGFFGSSLPQAASAMAAAAAMSRVFFMGMVLD